jgi:phosphate transport system protein
MNETRRTYHQDLDEVRNAIVRMASTVVEIIPRGTQILLDGDLEGADYLIQGDDEMDARALDAEEECYRLLTLQQPMAGDMRLLVSALHITGEIERSADLVVNICKGSRRIHGHPLDPKLRGIIGRMSDQAQLLFKQAIDAYVENDASKAAAIDDMDDLLDRLQTELVQAIFESHSTSSIDLQVAVQLAVIARFYERIGDHAVNIGERVRYMITGWQPEHVGRARLRARQAMGAAEPPTGAPAS